FPYYLAFGDSTHGGIATHLGDGLHVHGDEQDFRSKIGCPCCCFTTCMAGTYYYYIVFGKHRAKVREGGRKFCSTWNHGVRMMGVVSRGTLVVRLRRSVLF